MVTSYKMKDSAKTEKVDKAIAAAASGSISKSTGSSKKGNPDVDEFYSHLFNRK